MLKVLIVDDDKLTRKGLIAVMPWDKYGMEVAGESSNGVQALEFLDKHEVDLVLSDLEMPLMSGLEFMKQAKARYPGLQFVVLTVHTDFEYIQQALRLGAIDYIAKVQFDKENLDAILNRISDRMKKELEHSGSAVKDERIHADAVYVLIEEMNGDEDCAEVFLSKNDIWTKPGFHEMASGIWYWNRESNEFMFPEQFDGCMLLLVSRTQGLSEHQLEKALLKYKREKFFWDYTGNREIISYPYQELLRQQEPVDEEEFQTLKKRWLSFKWIQEESLFEKIRFDLKKSNLTVARLYHIMLALENAWNQNYGAVADKQITMPPEFHSWQDVEQWLGALYAEGAGLSLKSQLSGDIKAAILRAKQYADEHYTEHIVSEELAQRLNISRSYFSICFGRVVGVPFNEYLRGVRVRKAKEYLEYTQKSVAAVAEAVGYEDEKYFSRVFKKATGMSPGEYRKRVQRNGLADL